MKPSYFNHSDETLLKLICENNDTSAFEEVYSRYFKILFNYVFSKVNDQFVAQEIVQVLFIRLWQSRSKAQIQLCRPYLFSSVKNLIISHYRKELTRQEHYVEWQKVQTDTTNITDQKILTSDLQFRYDEGLHLLPPKCRQVFILSREGYSNKKIATELLVSEKTVEQHITKALRVLREHLKDHFAYAIALLQFL